MSVLAPFRPRLPRWFAGLLGGLTATSVLADLSLLKVSYDVSREPCGAPDKTHFADGGVYDQIAVKR